MSSRLRRPIGANDPLAIAVADPSAVNNTVQKRVVELSEAPRSFLVIDRQGRRWRAAFWWLREPRDVSPPASEEHFARLVADGTVPAKSKREAWRRRACSSEDLHGLCFELFDGHRSLEASTVERYLEAILQ